MATIQLPERPREGVTRPALLRSLCETQKLLTVSCGVVSKRRGAADGSPYGGQRFSRGALYLMLKNPLYRGQTVHKDKTFPGEHAAIVDEERWAKVQRRFRHTGRIGVGILGAIPNPGNTTVCRRRNGGERRIRTIGMDFHTTCDHPLRGSPGRRSARKLPIERVGPETCTALGPDSGKVGIRHIGHAAPRPHDSLSPLSASVGR